jgi:hypothetical protein
MVNGFITISDDRTIRRWDGQTGAPIGEPIRLPDPGRFAKVSPDGDVIITVHGDIIDANAWQMTKALNPRPIPLSNSFFSPDGSWLATASILSEREGPLPETFIELNQWDRQNAVRIAESIKITSAEDAGSDAVPTHWLEPGRSVAVGQNMVWQCTMPCSVERILPFLQACRPLILGEAGEQIINPNCSLDSVKLKSFFPQGRTEQNQAAYDFAERVLGRGSPVTK